jgi:hypothetical protein
MPVFKIACPACDAVLKSSNPMPPGKKVKCPKCGEGFTVPADGDDPEKAEKEAARAKPAAKEAPAAKKAAPAPPPPKANDDEDGTYKFIDEPQKERDEDDEEEEKPELSFALDTSVKDIRGPVRARLVFPTNCLIGFGVLGCVGYLLTVAWAVFPLIFSPEWTDPLEVSDRKPAKADEAPPTVTRADLKPDQLARLADLNHDYLIEHLGVMAFGIFGFVIMGLVVFGGVKMQNLESYGWALAGCITAILFGTILGLAVGLWNLVILMDKQVKEAFRVEAEDVRTRGASPY